MATANELLASLISDDPVHEHPVIDTDTRFVIDSETRVITYDSRYNFVVMQYDHNSERCTFELPRYIDGHDMTLCNRVRVHFNNIDGETGTEIADVAELNDLAIDPEDENKVLVSWVITRQSTQLVGVLSFLVQYMCVADDGTVTYEWHTDIFSDGRVKASRNNGEAAIIEYSNILEEWYQKLFGAGDSVVAEIIKTSDEQLSIIAEEGAAQMSAVESKGKETLESIPDDYTETYNNANKALRTRANAIVETVEGEAIVATDCSDDYLRSMRIFGKSTQESTTGAQLIPQPYADGKITINGVRFIVNPDGSVAASGTSTAGVNYYFVRNMTLPAGTYTFSMTGDLIGGRLYIYDFTELISLATLGEDISSVTFTTDVDYTNIGIYINTAYEGKIFGGRVYPMLNKGDAALPYEQYTGGMASPNPEYPRDIISASNPKIIIGGKNLWNPTKDYDVSGTYWGWKVKNTDKKMTITLIDKDPSVDLSGCYFGATGLGSEPTAGYRWLISKGVIYLTAYTTEYDYISIYPNNADTIDKLTSRFYIMVELGEEFTSYEDPRDEITMSIARSLNGIPVTSGGNYTDENGQQWLSDEIDFERGVYIQRIGKLRFDGSENWGLYDFQSLYSGFSLHAALDEEHSRSPGMSNQFSNFKQSVNDGIWVGVGNTSVYAISKDWYNKGVDAWKEHLNANPLEIIYRRITPIETPLTDEELFNFSQLHSNYLTTTILNDTGAHMEVSYNADTKTYLEQLPKATDAQVQAAVDAWLTAHFVSAEEASF